MSFSDLDHELVSLIADYLSVRDIATLAITCRLCHIGVYNSTKYNKLRTLSLVNKLEQVQHNYKMSELFNPTPREFN
jgi:hypothetical protein